MLLTNTAHNYPYATRNCPYAAHNYPYAAHNCPYAAQKKGLSAKWITYTSIMGMVQSIFRKACLLRLKNLLWSALYTAFNSLYNVKPFEGSFNPSIDHGCGWRYLL